MRFPDANDFGNEVIPGAKQAGMKVQAYAFKGYWEDIGTVEAFYNANLALTNPTTAQFRCAPLSLSLSLYLSIYLSISISHTHTHTHTTTTTTNIATQA